jgi:hypothetical protein
MARIALGASLVVVGCGDDGLDHGVVPPDGGFAPATHTPLPQVGANSGVIYAHPKLVTITYQDYAVKAQVEAWGDAVVNTSWWTTVGAEYGIGAMTHAAKYTIPVHSPNTTPIEDKDIEAEIKSLVATGVVPTPPYGDSEYIYMIYIPATVPLGLSLQGLGGYHAMVTLPSGTRYSYAVVLDDNNLDDTTVTSSHELIEAATDPYDPPLEGWIVNVQMPDPWYLALGEVADLCNFEDPVQEGAYMYQRSWSNAAAAADKNPCIPNQDEAWETVSADPATMPTLAAGDSMDFTLTGWSTALEMNDWTLDISTPADYSEFSPTEMVAHLSDKSINNGTTVTLTLKAPATAKSGQVGGMYVFSGPNYRPWVVGFVVQ